MQYLQLKFRFLENTELKLSLKFEDLCRN